MRPVAVAGNCKAPICGNRKQHTLFAGASAPDQAVGKTSRIGSATASSISLQTINSRTQVS